MTPEDTVDHLRRELRQLSESKARSDAECESRGKWIVELSARVAELETALRALAVGAASGERLHVAVLPVEHFF